MHRSGELGCNRPNLVAIVLVLVLLLLVIENAEDDDEDDSGTTIPKPKSLLTPQNSAG